MIRNKCGMIVLILVAIFVSALSLWGPELLAEYSQKRDVSLSIDLNPLSI